MKSNASLKEIAGKLNAAQTILIFTHTNPDGDALGSAAALCRVLRKMGKEAWILMSEDVPSYIGFMDTEFCTRDVNCLENHDISICVDCGAYNRFPELANKFDEGKLKICVDHHATVDGFGDFYYVDPSAAATCQLIYSLINELGFEFKAEEADSLIDKTVAESVYTGINTDTGCFQYSNTSAEVHRIAAEMIGYGVDHAAINVKLHQTVSMTKIKLQSLVLEKAELLNNGRTVISYVTNEMLEEVNAVLEDVEGITEIMRNIEGVEISVLLKEKKEGIKVSMRAKSYANVREIVSCFGGGGHVKAAGCTLEMPVEDALEALKKAIDEYWEKQA